jgi:hypothetical protein
VNASCYVYYRVSPSQSTRARHAVTALFEDLQKHIDVSCRLARRSDDPGTWMEIYERFRDPDEFRVALESATERHGLGALTGQRTVETFIADVLLPEGSGDSQCA